MKNKSDAERTEARLLDTYDYAWNKERNGACRCNDIRQKLDHHASNPTQLLPTVSKLHIFRPKKVGVRIRNCGPFFLENRSSFYKKQVGRDLLSRIFKFRRSRPIVISKESGLNEDHTSFCGVALGQGSVCTRMPVAGRKRCADHNGMKINGSTPKLIGNQCGSQGFLPTCGAPLADDSFCTREPITGRKRCQEHKGRRTSASISSPVIVEGNHFTRGKWCGQHGSYSSSGSISCRSYSNEDYSYPSTCAAITQRGNRCSRQATAGRQTCWQH